MSWNRTGWVPRTLRCRLTLWFAGLFLGLSLLAFGLVDTVLRASLQTRLDERLMGRAREYEALYREYGIRALQDEFRREVDAVGAENLLLVFRSPGLEVLACSDLEAWEGVSLHDPGRAVLPAGEASFRTLHAVPLDTDVRMVEARTADGHLVQVGESLARDQGLVRRYRTTVGAVLVAMLGIGTCLGWVLTRSALSGVERVTLAALRIGNDDLTLRVPARQAGEEINRLAGAFNDMLDRIERLVRELRQVTGDIAHDLRSPLTRVRVAAESVLSKTPEGPDSRALAATVIEECDRLVTMIDTMLEITQAEAGSAPMVSGPVDLTALVHDAVELFVPMAENRHLSLAAEVPPAPVVVQGSLPRLQRVVANLVDNALKYTPAGGRVTVGLSPSAAGATIRVADTGPGIPPAQCQRVFDRYFRGDASRSTPGNGLGLPLARALARAHGGEIRVESVVGKGSTFTVWLPQREGPGPLPQGVAQ